MRNFTILWLGQLVSTLGSYMTVFALMIWVWQQTESATTLALVTFFSQLPRIIITPMAGIIVDRFRRKHLMLLGDVVALFSTLAVGLLYLYNWGAANLAFISGGGAVWLLWTVANPGLFRLNYNAGGQAALHQSRKHDLDGGL
jgi:MFS family permease